MKIVIDTNIIISGLFYSMSKQHQILQMVVDNDVEAYCSKQIKAEYEQKIMNLNDPIKKSKNFKNGVFDNQLWKRFFSVLNEITVYTKVDICRDPDDNKFLECAIEADCQFITSGDNDLLVLKEFRGIRIVDTSTFLAEYKEKGYEP